MDNVKRFVIVDWITVMGATMMIVLSLGVRPFSRFLLSRIPQFLGKVSYSIYLLHGTFLFALLHWSNRRIPAIWLFVIYVPAVLLASVPMYHLVEKPLMDFGRKITTRKQPMPELKVSIP